MSTACVRAALLSMSAAEPDGAWNLDATMNPSGVEALMVSICVTLLGVTLGGSHCRRAPEVTSLHSLLRLQVLPTSVNGESGSSSLCLSTKTH